MHARFHHTVFSFTHVTPYDDATITSETKLAEGVHFPAGCYLRGMVTAPSMKTASGIKQGEHLC